MRTSEAVRGRKFGLLDAMILVVAAALSLFWLRERSKLDVGWTFYGRPRSLFFAWATIARGWYCAVIPILAPLTCASVVFRLRSPRPSRRRALCQPGLVACLAATSVFAYYFAIQVVAMAPGLVWRHPDPAAMVIYNLFPNDSYELGSVAAFSGVAILAAWLNLALGHRWRPEASWVDRLGKLLGLVWIATIPVEITFEVLWPLGLSGKL